MNKCAIQVALGVLVYVAAVIDAAAQTGVPAVPPSPSVPAFGIAGLHLRAAAAIGALRERRHRPHRDAHPRAPAERRGCAALGNVDAAYASATQRFDVTVFEVHKPDGQIVRGDPSAIQDVAVQPEAVGGVFQDFRQKHLTVPALKAGDRLVLRMAWITHTPMVPGQFFLLHRFTDEAVVLDERLEIDIPEGRPVVTDVSPAAPREQADMKGTVANGRRVYRWHHSRLQLPDPSTSQASRLPPLSRRCGRPGSLSGFRKRRRRNFQSTFASGAGPSRKDAPQ